MRLRFIRGSNIKPSCCSQRKRPAFKQQPPRLLAHSLHNMVRTEISSFGQLLRTCRHRKAIAIRLKGKCAPKQLADALRRPFLCGELRAGTRRCAVPKGLIACSVALCSHLPCKTTASPLRAASPRAQAASERLRGIAAFARRDASAHCEARPRPCSLPDPRTSTAFATAVCIAAARRARGRRERHRSSILEAHAQR